MAAELEARQEDLRPEIRPRTSTTVAAALASVFGPTRLFIYWLVRQGGF